jgi:hypothetical protein
VTITRAELEKRRGVNVGFFYLREKGSLSARKVSVFVDGKERRVWDGARWRRYDEFEPEIALERAIERCSAFNGPLGS